MVRAAQLALFSCSGRSPAEGRLADQIGGSAAGHVRPGLRPPALCRSLRAGEFGHAGWS